MAGLVGGEEKLTVAKETLTEFVAGLHKRAKINSLNPAGWTPIADSLKQAADDFSRCDVETNENVVYLVSDGIEACDGAPVVAAQALNQLDVSTVVNVIGFDVDADSAAQLRSVAQSGGREYIEADNRSDLDRIFNETAVSAYGQYNYTAIAQCLSVFMKMRAD